MKPRIASEKEVEYGVENGVNTLELCAMILLWLIGAQENSLIGHKKKKKVELAWLKVQILALALPQLTAFQFFGS